jgi:hypothetical protein
MELEHTPIFCPGIGTSPDLASLEGHPIHPRGITADPSGR